jgi:hypothetical protein
VKEATLYKITNTVNNKCYYGIVFGKKQTPEKRFEEHMSGKGGKLLYEYGVKEFGRENFKLEIIEKGELNYIRDLEVQNNKNNLYPAGYNGNTSHAITLTPKQIQQMSETKKQMFSTYPEKKPIPPTWKGKKRSVTMRKKLSASKMGHTVSNETRKKISSTLKGRKQSEETKLKRATTTSKNPNGYGRRHWLAINPNNIYYYTHGKVNELFKKIKVARGVEFYKNLNTGIPSKTKRPKISTVEGWLFYNDEQKIKQLLEEAKFKNYQIITNGIEI